MLLRYVSSHFIVFYYTGMIASMVVFSLFSRGFPLGGPDKRIRMDFADVENMPPPRGYQGSDFDPNIARQAGHPGPKVLDTFFQ